MDKPFAARDLPPECFPFWIKFFNLKDKLVHEIEVTEPGVTEIPALQMWFGPCRVEVHYPTGQVVHS